MFDFFKKKEKLLYAPIKGKCISLEEVPDQMFANKIMGEGLAFVPESNIVVSPCNGVVSMVAVTKHAIGIVNNDGVEILIHIGLDTVNYQGKGFEVAVKNNQRVKKGDTLINFDKDFFEQEKVNLVTPMIITNHAQFEIKFMNCNNIVEPSDSVIEYMKKI